jgi:hypothetical protein
MKRVVFLVVFLGLCGVLFAENPFVGEWRIILSPETEISTWELFADMTGLFRFPDGEGGDLIYEIDEEESILKIGPKDQFEEDALVLSFEIDESGEVWWGFFVEEEMMSDMLYIDASLLDKELTELEEELLDALMETAFIIGVRQE